MSPTVASASDQLTAVMAESATLEQALRQLRADQRVTDAYTTRAAASLEDRIADLDRRLEAAQVRWGLHRRRQPAGALARTG